MPEQKGVTLWFTGLSGSGKTTLALALEERLKFKGYRVQRLDGDVLRQHLTRDLGFSKKDRDENIHRVSFVAGLLTQQDIITLCCFISPYRRARSEARELIGSFIEVYVNAPLEVCEARDVKGLYKKARAGEIKEFTGISDPYEEPENPEIELLTGRLNVGECTDRLVNYLQDKNYIS